MFLEISRTDRYHDVSLSNWIVHTPQAMVGQAPDLDRSIIGGFPAGISNVVPV